MLLRSTTVVSKTARRTDRPGRPARIEAITALWSRLLAMEADWSTRMMTSQVRLRLLWRAMKRTSSTIMRPVSGSTLPRFAVMVRRQSKSRAEA